MPSSTKKPDVDLVASQVSVQDFTSAVFAGVMRALESQKPQIPGKIIYGIIYDPTALPTVIQAERATEQ